MKSSVAEVSITVEWVCQTSWGVDWCPLRSCLHTLYCIVNLKGGQYSSWDSQKLACRSRAWKLAEEILSQGANLEMGIPNHHTGMLLELLENSIWASYAAAASRTIAQWWNKWHTYQHQLPPLGYQMSHMPDFVRLLIKTWPAFIILSRILNEFSIGAAFQ